MKKSLTAAIAALTFGGAIAASAAPAQARDYYGDGQYYGQRRHGNSTGTAIAAGALGLALGAALSSANRNSRSGYYNNGSSYYNNGSGYYNNGSNYYNNSSSY